MRKHLQDWLQRLYETGRLYDKEARLLSDLIAQTPWKDLWQFKSTLAAAEQRPVAFCYGA